MKVLILDDDLNGAKLLLRLIGTYCPDLRVIALETNVDLAIKDILLEKPELIFLNVKHLNGQRASFTSPIDYPFEVIYLINRGDEEVPFFENAGLEYLKRPINPDELVQAVERAKIRMMKPEQPPSATSLSVQAGKLMAPVSDGILVLDLAQVIRFEAQGGYTKVIQERQALLLSQHLGVIEQFTPKKVFLRIHRSHLINKNHIVKYFSSDGGTVLMSNGEHVPISRDRKKDFLNRLLE